VLHCCTRAEYLPKYAEPRLRRAKAKANELERLAGSSSAISQLATTKKNLDMEKYFSVSLKYGHLLIFSV